MIINSPLNEDGIKGRVQGSAQEKNGGDIIL